MLRRTCNAITGRKKDPETEEITVVACAKCGRAEERAFARGDVVLGPAGAASSDGASCASCGGTMLIKQVFIRKLDS